MTDEVENPSDGTDNHEPDTLPATPESATDSASGGVSGDSPPEVSILSLVADTVGEKSPDAPAVELRRDGLPKRKPGRPRKNQSLDGAAFAPNAGQSPPAAPQVKTPAQRRANKVSSDEISRALVNSGVGALVAFIGPEWDFESAEEAQGVKGAVSAYIEAKGDGNISPEAMLALVLAGYAMPRTAHENTRQKLSRFFGGIWGFLVKPFKRD